MKYKIENVEVEAIQWKGGLDLNIITDFLKELGFRMFCVERNRKFGTSLDVHANTLSHLSPITLMENDYLVKTKTSLFKLSEQDFNNMVTKVKEPKFKVGDKAYLLGSRAIWLDKVTSITIKGWYILDSDDECEYEESELLTLEEAIEKLKEL